MDHRRSSIPWSVPVAVGDIPDEGRHYDLVADQPSLEAVARHAGLRALSGLRAAFDLKRKGEAVTVQGEVTAQAGQTCVVTLEPLESDVREAVDLVFAPPAGEADVSSRARKQEPPEPLENGVIDLGNIATEFLVLGLDPYPRKAGAEFAVATEGSEGAHPFAGLAALKKRS
jgi:uncharacterized metal-binding protein YceD (DUF177 family)